MEINQKILILLFYYNRPKLVKNALFSIINSTYSNYEIAFINDSEDESSDYILDFLKDSNNYSKFKQYNIKQTAQEKIEQGGSIFGKYANLAINESDADIVIMLCDDDALLPNYLEDLNKYYNINQDIVWAYSKVKYYMPPEESYLQAQDNFERVRYSGVVANLNVNISPINPDCNCDASQVSFRKKCFIEKNIWYPYPQTRNLDSAIYSRMYNAWGNCQPTNIYGQCKGVFSEQLGARSNDFEISIK